MAKTKMIISHNDLTPEEFIDLRIAVGLKVCPKHQVAKALRHTMYSAKAIVNGETVAMGRIVGDYSIKCCLTGVCVKPQFQKQGIGLEIVKELIQMVKDGISAGEKIQIELIPAFGTEKFYQKAGFKYKPEIAIGMYLWIEK